MKNTLALYENEMRHYFRSPIAYFVVAVFLVGTGYFFTFNVFLTGNATMTDTLRNMGILLLLVIPLISMRLFSSEYRAGTMELLQTLPFRTWELVLGKYLGAVTILVMMTGFTLINLIPLYLYGNPETSTIACGYIGFILLGMASLALGQLFSALTENQIVAALLTVSVLLGFWFIGHLTTFQNSYWIAFLVNHLSFQTHFGEFVQGLLRSESVIYYGLIIIGCLFVNARYFDWRR